MSKLRKNVSLHYRLADIRFGVLLVASIALVYLLSLPVVVRFGKSGFGTVPRVFYAAGVWSYEKSILARPLRKYASLWIGDRSVGSYFVVDADVESGIQTVARPNELLSKQDEYQRKLTELYEKQRELLQAWPVEYKRELESLQEKFQRAGDYHSWEIVQQELSRFESEGGVTDALVEEPVGLVLLLDKYRKLLEDQRLLHCRNLVKETKLYVNALREMQTRFMQNGEIEFASVINSEILKVNGTPKYVEAQSVVDSSDATRLTDVERSPDVLLTTTGGPRLGEITALRERFEDSLEKASTDHAEKISFWPEEYLSRLAQLRDEYQRAGDYDGWEDVSKEIERFEVDLGIAPEHLQFYQPKLMKVQNEFRLKKDRYRKDYAETVVKTTEGYLEKLQSIVKRLTVEGKMDEAAEVNTEIKRVKALAEYVKAKKELIVQGPPVPAAESILEEGATEGAAAEANGAPAGEPAAENGKPEKEPAAENTPQ